MSDEGLSLPRELKKRLRDQALARRNQLNLQSRIEMSLGVSEAGQDIALSAGDVVSGFWPIRSEPDVRPLMASLSDRGARLSLPAIIDATTIVFRELVRGGPLIDMGFGTQGPGPSAAELLPDLMLVPLAAFDDRGHRIGYGAGYYDRAISTLHTAGRTPVLIGVAFSCQQVERVPDEPHDVALHGLLTENGLHWFANSR